MSETFATREREALTAVLFDEDVAEQLSPLALSFAGVVSLGIDVAETLAEVGQLSPQDAAKFAISAGLQLAQQVAAAIGESAAGLADMIPVVNMILGAAFSQNYAGQSPQQVEQAALDWCRSSYRAIRGTGPGHAIHPADVFIHTIIPSTQGGGQADSHGHRVYRPGVGEALVAIETQGVGNVLTAYRSLSGQTKVGIPTKVRTALRDLRDVIELSAFTGDDATIAWLLYMDLLTGAFKRGEMTDRFADFLATIPNGLDLSTPEGLTLLAIMTKKPVEASKLSPWNCRRWGRPGVEGVLQMIEGWKFTVEPRWNADKAAASKIVAESHRQVDRMTRVALLKRALKKPRIRFHFT